MHNASLEYPTSGMLKIWKHIIYIIIATHSSEIIYYCLLLYRIYLNNIMSFKRKYFIRIKKLLKKYFWRNLNYKYNVLWNHETVG
jgi:hypothetical protein